jgi:hypothetical protein
LAAWQAAVGQVASADAVLAPVDDQRLLAALLPAEMGFMRFGGENGEQFAEYHRSKRLAEVVKRALPGRETRQGNGLTAATAEVEFAAWLAARRADQQTPPGDLEDLVAELADSWCFNGIDEVYTACSPHRVALTVLHVRNAYIDEFADHVVALLPDWTQWLATRNGTPPELADRCVPYLNGQPHPQLGRDDGSVDYLACVVE